MAMESIHDYCHRPPAYLVHTQMRSHAHTYSRAHAPCVSSADATVRIWRIFSKAKKNRRVLAEMQFAHSCLQVLNGLEGSGGSGMYNLLILFATYTTHMHTTLLLFVVFLEASYGLMEICHMGIYRDVD